MVTTRTVTVKGTKQRRHIAEGVISACQHRISFWYEIGRAILTETDLEYLEAEAEERARAMIAEDYHSGQLCCALTSPVRQVEREFYGWWGIED